MLDRAAAASRPERRSSSLHALRELLRHRDLLWMLTWRDVRVRYKQTVMGFLWAVFMPFLIVFAGLFVKKAFSLLSGKPIEVQEIASVATKALPWAFFVAAIRFATSSLTGNSNLVTKIYFPREVFPLAAVLANLVDFAVASVFLVAALAVMQLGVSIYLLWLPLLVLLLVLLTAGLGMLLSCANLFFRDVKYVVEVLLTFGIFFTPVFYEASMFGDWARIILLNPVATILEAMNDVVVLHRAPQMAWLAYAALCSVLGLVIAWNIFDRAEPWFAENI